MMKFIVDVPKTGDRRFFDDYNQAEFIAKELADRYPGTDVFVYSAIKESYFCTPLNPKLELIKTIKNCLSRPIHPDELGGIYSKLEELEKLIRDEKSNAN